MPSRQPLSPATAAAWVLAACFGLSAAAASAAVDDAAVTLVQDTTNSLLTGIDADGGALRTDPDRLNAFVDAQVAPHFDFERFARIITGRHWRQATTEQRDRLQRSVRDRLVRTIATGLSQYSDQQIEFLPQRTSSKPDRTVVRMQIRQAGGQSITLGYRLYESDGTWKIYDVLLDGVSMLKTYQTQASAHVRQKGMDSFIETVAH